MGDDDIVKEPIFPTGMSVHGVSNSTSGENGICLTIRLDEGEEINAIIPLDAAIGVAKEMMGHALSAMDPDQIEELDDIQVMRMPGADGPEKPVKH